MASLSDQTDTPKKAEFDSFAADYSGGMDNSVKALLGNSGEDFLAVKLDWMLRHFLNPGDASSLNSSCVPSRKPPFTASLRMRWCD